MNGHSAMALTPINMKKSDIVKRERERCQKKLKGIIRHIRNVQDNCIMLGEKLIEKNELELGRLLIAGGGRKKE